MERCIELVASPVASAMAALTDIKSDTFYNQKFKS